MKNIINLVFFSFFLYFFSSCMFPYKPQDTGKLMVYPIIPHTKEVEIYFQNEKPADTAYLKLRVIDVYGSMYSSTGEMISLLKKEAQKYGVDALLFLDEKSFLEVTTRFPLYRNNYIPPYNFNNYKMMSAIGIKYKRNIMGVENYMQKQNIQLYDSVSKNYKTIVEVKVDLTENANNISEIVPKTSNYYKNYIQKYSLAWLIEAKNEDWLSNTEVEEYTIFETKRVYKRNDWTQKVKVFYKYNINKQIEQVRIKEIEKNTQYLKFFYANKNSKRPNLLKVEEKGKLIYKQVFVVDENQKLQSAIFYKVENGQEIPFLRVIYSYFDKNSF